MDILSKTFAIFFASSGLFLFLYSFGSAKKKELTIAMLYCAAAIFCVTRETMIQFFITWETMAILSTTLIAVSENKFSRKIALRYFIWHITGGVILASGLAGLAMQEGITEVWEFQSTKNLNQIYYLLIFIGILVNTAVFPFSAWLVESYPKSGKYGTLFLSIFTTKTALYALMQFFSELDILIYIGLFSYLYGMIYAIFAQQYKRILAYAIVSHLGFLIIAIAFKDLSENIYPIMGYVVSGVIAKLIFFMAYGMLKEKHHKIRNIKDMINTIQDNKISTKWIAAPIFIAAFNLVGFGFSLTYFAKGFISYELHYYPNIYLLYYVSIFISAIFVLKLVYPFLFGMIKFKGLQNGEKKRGENIVEKGKINNISSNWKILLMNILAFSLVAMGFIYMVYFDYHFDKKSFIVKNLLALLGIMLGLTIAKYMINFKTAKDLDYIIKNDLTKILNYSYKIIGKIKDSIVIKKDKAISALFSVSDEISGPLRKFTHNKLSTIVFASSIAIVLATSVSYI